jgi:hypothetical protein
MTVNILRHPIQLTIVLSNSRKSQQNVEKICCDFPATYFYTPKKIRKKIATYFHENLLRRENLLAPRTSKAPQLSLRFSG